MKKRTMMITELHGINRLSRNLWGEPECLPATRANLAYLLDWADYRRLETRGAFGNVGCGETTVAVINDGRNLRNFIRNSKRSYPNCFAL